MAYLINKETNEQITRFVSIATKQEVIRVVHQTLDGVQHIQRIGRAAQSVELTLYVDGTGKEQLMEAEDRGVLLEAGAEPGVYLGRIMQLGAFENLAAGYCKAAVSLALEPEDVT